MQYTIPQLRLQGIQGESAKGASSKLRGNLNTELADPFLQIIMNLISQSMDTAQAQDLQLSQGMGELLDLPQLQQPGLLQTQLSSLLQIRQPGLPQPNVQLSLYQAPFADALETLQLDLIGTQTPQSAAIEQLTVQSDMEDILALMQANQTTALRSEATAASTVQQAAPQLAKPFTESNGAQQSSSLAEAFAQTTGLSAENGLPVITVAPGGGLSSAQSEFGGALKKAKEMLSQAPKQEKREELDVDTLQSRVSQSKVSTPFELRFKTTPSVSETALADQISDGIKQNLSLGKSEFTMKLRPENLGEITVKLIEEAGKTTLSITTSSSQTAKLINSELSALKLAVAPMNVEVNEAVTQTGQSQEGAMQGLDMAGQQFAQQQFASEQFAGQHGFARMSRGTDRAGNDHYSDEIVEAAGPAALHTLMSDRLDAYI